ncbi:HNH endonuclease [Streptomyces rimosus subsp. pseudoverticillatus]|uniref:HNH endonuclease n=1 Tax=Streptomyces rimosus TaxID=1927 RepID=UPI0006B2A763|nr:HNH endonuclease [Streptomyces rimosus]KOT98862.1 HNH endonuclease [Streptomyces rimosus subsp. pseudoverticillatus]
MGTKYTRELLIEAALASTSYEEAARHCGSTPTRSVRYYISRRMAEERIDTAHFTSGAVRHSETTLREAVALSHSTAEVVRRLGIHPVGGNQAHIAHRIAELDLDTTHFTTARPRRPQRPIADRLVLGSPSEGRLPGDRLRRALLRRGIREQCAMCGTGPVWNGRPLRLEVDHRNGDWWDNRPTNLRLLCPNCHAVTDTYRGRKRRAPHGRLP